MAERMKTRMRRLEGFLKEEEDRLTKNWPDVNYRSEDALIPYRQRMTNIETAKRVMDWLKSQQEAVDRSIIVREKESVLGQRSKQVCVD